MTAIRGDRRVSRGEVPAVGGLLLVVGFAALAWHIAHGGFYSDDWSNAANYHFASSPRYLHAVRHEMDDLGSRPGLAILLPIPHAVFGVHPGAQIALAAVLAALMCLVFHVFLRTVGLGAVHAAAIASLVVLFPWADSIRLWPTASVGCVPIAIALAGATLSLRAAERQGRAAALRHAAALVLFACSVLTYEMAAGGLLLLGALYLPRMQRRRALRWWVLDVIVVGSALAYEGATTTSPVSSVSQHIHAIPEFTRESLEIFSLLFVPYGVPKGTTTDICEAVAFAAAAIVVALAVRRVVRTGDPDLTRWLMVAAGSVVAVAAAYAVLVGTYLKPDFPGTANRVNLFAALGYTTLAYAVLLMAARLVASRPAREPVVAIALVALLGAGFAVRFGKDEAAWDRAARLQGPVLDAAASYAETLPRDSVVFTFGASGEVPAAIPVFDTDWDTTGALRLRTNDSSLRAYPVFDGVQIACEAAGIATRIPNETDTFRASYRSSYFIDVRTGRRVRVSSRSICRGAVKSFPLAPLDA